MSQFTKSLEKRIQELTALMDAQKTELAAYERVLRMELSKGNASAETDADSEGPASDASARSQSASEDNESENSAPVVGASSKINKTTMVADVVRSRGSQGATPKDVDAFFTAKNIGRSKNLVYNTLSYLVAHKKLERRDGRYFVLEGGGLVAKKRGRKPGSKATGLTKRVGKKTAGSKRRLSPEGLQRIREALKRRWAAKTEQSGMKAAGKTAAKKQ